MITGVESPGPLRRATFGPAVQREGLRATKSRAGKSRREEQRERAIVSDFDQVAGPLDEPSDDGQADVPSEPGAVTQETSDEVETTSDEAEATLDAQEADPVAAFEAELRRLPGEWYAVHSYAGYENRVRTNLESRTQSLNMEDYIFQIEVPTHEVIEVKGGKRQQVQEKVLPGYILVRMDLTDEAWAAVRNTPGVTGFVGLSSRPSPLSLDEVMSLLAPVPV